MSSKQKIHNRQAGVRVLILVAVLILLNMLAGRFHSGIDLTQEHRFTLSAPTKKMLKDLPDVVYVDVLLDGKNFPAGFQRLKESVRERLQSFRDASGGKVIFKFRDPFDGIGEEGKAKVFSKLAEKGVNGVNIRESGSDKYSEQIVFPYAIVKYRDKELPVKLLESHIGFKPLEILNYSESQLEYKFASAIRSLMRPDKPHLAYLVGNGEPLDWHTYDALTALQKLYHVDTVDLSTGTHIPTVYDAALIVKPQTPFDDKEKFKIDQYVMKGGRLLLMMDAANASLDSLGKNSEEFLATPHDLNLDDMLFKWGVRVNNDLIEDLQSNRIPVVTGMVGDQPQVELKNWFYMPVFIPTSQNPIVRNMDAIMSNFVSTIDTVATPGIKKTILLESSKYSRPTMVPARISLSMLRYPPRQELYNKGNKATAVLLEGRFQSVFQDRLAPEFLKILKDSIHDAYRPMADSPTAVIVVSDGDMFLNGVNPRTGPQELGYWDYDKTLYANKSFLLNCLEYLTDKTDILEARNKESRLRLLDAGRARDERSKWQIVNLAVPLGLLAIFASAFIFFRRRRYGAH
ncbi:MAG: gliding motility-associated ABC transporter substrate-binding protein GldG [Chitinophagaceae bacterium]